jgi:hypothetical protein
LPSDSLKAGPRPPDRRRLAVACGERLIRDRSPVLSESKNASPAILGAGALLYALAVLSATLEPNARNWGVHLPAFLPAALRLALLGLFLAAAGLVMSGLVWKETNGKEPEGVSGPSRRPRRRGPAKGVFATPALGLLLIPFGALLWVLRSRTELLGDGTVWIGNTQSGIRELYSEPLFATIWHGFAAFLRILRLPVEAETLRFLSIASGIIAAALIIGITREIAAGRRDRIAAGLLLFTIGSMQLYFGYIESYPVGSLFIWGYLWAALRFLNGFRFWPVSALLTLAIAAHLSALFLVPSYWLLASQVKEPIVRRWLAAVAPLVAAGLLLVLLGYRASNWLTPMQAATRGFRQDFTGPLYRRPYSWLSMRHAQDIGNAFLLVLPVPLLLLIQHALAIGARPIHLRGSISFLAAAALPGALMAVCLMTPVAPAQDWDFTAMLLLPTAVLGVAAGFAPGAPRLPVRVSWGLVALSGAGLLSFVLVNASERASLARFKLLVSDEGTVSRYGRAYGSEILDRFYRDRKDYAAALPYARAALAAEAGNPRYWVNLGTDLYELHRYGDAIPVNLEAVRRAPGRWEARYNLGLCYMETGHYAEAVPTLREAVRLEKNRPEVRHDLGIALYKSGQTDSAFVVWQEILDRWPKYAAAIPDSGTP